MLGCRMPSTLNLFPSQMTPYRFLQYIQSTMNYLDLLSFPQLQSLGVGQWSGEEALWAFSALFTRSLRVKHVLDSIWEIFEVGHVNYPLRNLTTLMLSDGEFSPTSPTLSLLSTCQNHAVVMDLEGEYWQYLPPMLQRSLLDSDFFFEPDGLVTSLSLLNQDYRPYWRHLQRLLPSQRWHTIGTRFPGNSQVSNLPGNQRMKFSFNSMPFIISEKFLASMRLDSGRNW